VELGPLDEEGVLAGALQVPSPNCDERPADEAVRLLVVHNISLPPGQFGGEPSCGYSQAHSIWPHTPTTKPFVI